jgi:hypothetical protein
VATQTCLPSAFEKSSDDHSRTELRRGYYLNDNKHWLKQFRHGIKQHIVLLFPAQIGKELKRFMEINEIYFHYVSLFLQRIVRFKERYRRF